MPIKEWDEDPRDHDDPWAHSPKRTGGAVGSHIPKVNSPPPARSMILTEQRVQQIVAEEVGKAFQQIMDRLDLLQSSMS